ncbi:MAG TPA: UDP-N-acetylmuramoyl-L-alanyl-D-glutamate--2,6-diaminopimelate ligase [Pyrinomonadaceae bacterium]|jgi:UDP-N-acetylmuramoyl-L-alanyl-D-glutamate--2,6-diaminopimelate ligase|nr:UDP-N-acetylmuramoyl-L-alanyl-D-glutamate--2,6-diaminopimelate ligase [Pyrinomonadaceae bacterium]
MKDESIDAPAGARAITAGDVARAVGGQLTGDGSVPVVDVTHDSRQVRAAWLFVAVRGANVDAHRFVRQAQESGASAVISERERPEDFEGAWIQVRDARRALALAAAEVHAHPSRELKLIGITGTNGKTTTAYLVAALVESAGARVALLSTVEYRIAGERTAALHTTPEASDVQRFLRRAVEAGCGVAVMEASSQALDLHRCDALRFHVAAFTNLTRDHLDYHGTMENYFASKRRLFDGSIGERPRLSVINADDPSGAKLARELEAEGAHVVRYALDAGADITARDVQFTLEGMTFRLRTPQGERQIESPLTGRPHVYNILTAAACGLAVGFDLDAIAGAVKSCAGAPGRFERVPYKGDFAVVVDYAHTDDALLNVLQTAREVSRGRVITVFGCGGERDRTKRAPMGEIASRLSDTVIVTSDNPRKEDPEAILADIEEGLRAAGKPYLKIADRRAAIRRAVAEAQPGDVVLIAGKGHEDYQIIGEEKHHFDDREVAREALAARDES